MTVPLTSDDRWAISDLFARYARYYDTADVDGYVSCFTEDGVYALYDRRYEGHEQIRSAISGIMAEPSMAGRQHHVGQLLFDGDSERCRVESYSTGLKLEDGGSCFVAFVGHYRDVVVKVEDKWLFAERHYRRWDGDVLNMPRRAELAST